MSEDVVIEYARRRVLRQENAAWMYEQARMAYDCGTYSTAVHLQQVAATWAEFSRTVRPPETQGAVLDMVEATIQAMLETQGPRLNRC